MTFSAVVCALVLCITYCCAAAVTYPTVDPVAWVSGMQLIGAVGNSFSLYAYADNQSVARVSPADGALLWYSPKISPFAVLPTFAVNEHVYMMNTATAVAIHHSPVPFTWVVNATTGAIVWEGEAGYTCGNSILPIGPSWFVCITQDQQTVTLLNELGQSVWTNNNTGLVVSGSLSYDTTTSKIYFVGLGVADDSALVLLDTDDWTMTTVPNISFVSPSALRGVVLCLLADDTVAAFDINKLRLLWSVATVAPMVQRYSTVDLVLVGTVGVLVGTSNAYFDAPLFLSFDLINGGLFGNTTAAAIGSIENVLVVEDLLVLNIQNNTLRQEYAVFDPSSQKWSFAEIPSGQPPVVIPSSTYRPQQVVAVNGQGYVRFNTSLGLVSYNLNLPGFESLFVFPDVPMVGNATVVGTTGSGNTTAIVF